MDNGIATIIAGAFGVSGVVIGNLLNHALNNRFQAVDKHRRVILTGKWQGEVQDEIDGAPAKFELSVELTAKWTSIKGEAKATYSYQENSTKATLEIQGRFLYDKFFQMEYKNNDPSKLQFGSATFELSADGRTMVGQYVGYGLLTQNLVSGNVRLNKTV